jgi:mercuric ion transport protein
MTNPAADRTPRSATVLGGLAGLACAACCLLPALIAAGVVGAGAGAAVGLLPAVAAALAVGVGATWWLSRRRAGRGCGSTACDAGGCGCRQAGDPLQITPAARR